MQQSLVTAPAARRSQEATSTPRMCRTRRDTARASCLAGCLLFALAATWHFHDRVWISYDDGAYLHVAERLLHGEVLNRDVQDIHLGYVNFTNALALRLFGNDAVSLRYPLVGLAVVNAALAFALLARRGVLIATVGSVAVTCLSVVQFMDPTAHWYALTLTLLTLAALRWVPPGRPGRYVLIGFLVGLVVCYRQLTGVFVAMGVLLYLLTELPRAAAGHRSWLSRGCIALMGLALVLYLARKTEPVAFVAYGTWPLLALAWGWRYARPADRDVARMLAGLAAGGALPFLPLLAYHVHHGSVAAWIDDSVATGVTMTRLAFFDEVRFWRYATHGARQAVLHPVGLPQTVIGLFWVAVPLVPVVLGAVLARALWRARGQTSRPTSVAPVPPEALVAVFYFLVALHFQKFMYFFFAAPLVAVALLSLAGTARSVVLRRAVAVGLLAFSAVAFTFLAGRFNGDEFLRRPRPRLVADHHIPKCGLLLDADLATAYQTVLALVERDVAAGESIFTAPTAPELYYLTGRRNPTRFYNTALGLRHPADVDALERQFERDPPKLVFYDPYNPWNTAQCRVLMKWFADRYEPLEPVGKFFKVYRYRGPARQATSAPSLSTPTTTEARDGQHP